MQIKIAIADTNVSYLERLSNVLETYRDIKVSSFSNAESLAGALDRKRFNLLLLDASMYDPRCHLEHAELTVFLSGDTKIPYECGDMPQIRKYQRGSEIYRQVLSLAAERLHLMSAAEAGWSNVIAFYSPVGGSGKTTAALVAATRLALLGERVMYLNLESIPSDDVYLPQRGEKGISAILERLDQSKTPDTLHMKSLLQQKTDKFYYIKHFDSLNDYPAMSEEDLERLINLFRRSGYFDYLILDLDSTYDKKACCLLDLADKIVLLEKPDALSRTKLEIFLAQPIVIEEFTHKMARLMNFYNGKNAGVASEIPQIGRFNNTTGADSASLITAKANNPESDFVLQLKG